MAVRHPCRRRVNTGSGTDSVNGFAWRTKVGSQIRENLDQTVPTASSAVDATTPPEPKSHPASRAGRAARIVCARITALWSLVRYRASMSVGTVLRTARRQCSQGGHEAPHGAGPDRAGRRRSSASTDGCGVGPKVCRQEHLAPRGGLPTVAWNISRHQYFLVFVGCGVLSYPVAMVGGAEISGPGGVGRSGLQVRPGPDLRPVTVISVARGGGAGGVQLGAGPGQGQLGAARG